MHRNHTEITRAFVRSISIQLIPCQHRIMVANNHHCDNMHANRERGGEGDVIACFDITLETSTVRILQGAAFVPRIYPVIIVGDEMLIADIGAYNS